MITKRAAFLTLWMSHLVKLPVGIIRVVSEVDLNAQGKRSCRSAQIRQKRHCGRGHHDAYSGRH